MGKYKTYDVYDSINDDFCYENLPLEEIAVMYGKTVKNLRQGMTHGYKIDKRYLVYPHDEPITPELAIEWDSFVKGIAHG